MTAPLTPEEYAHGFAFDMRAWDLMSPRSQQSDSGQVGVSDIGSCREKVRRMIVQSPQTDSPEKLAAIVGNAVDRLVKEARSMARPGLLHDVELTITLPSGLRVPGHADEIDPDEPSVTDVKTKDGLATIRRVGSDQQQRFQRHLYYLGALQAGIIQSDQGVVRNVFIDRSGKDPHPHVEQEPFSMDVVNEADQWLQDAVYAAQHGEEASKDWYLPMCRDYCPFFSACRGGEDPTDKVWIADRMADILEQAVTAKETIEQWTPIYEQARQELVGLTGRNHRHQVRSTWVNNQRSPHYKVEVGRVE